MKTNIATAAREYATRPKDERFPSWDALITAAEYDRTHSKELMLNLKDLAIVTTDQYQTSTGPVPLDQPTVQLENRATGRRASFTHWSFGQLCSSIGAPAHYLRTLPPENIAKDLNWGLQYSPKADGKRANILLRANGEQPIVRAATSDTYGRAWTAELHTAAKRYFGDGVRSSDGGQWQSPPTWSGETAGYYRGDRDDFVLRIDGGSIVGDPRGFGGGGNGRLNRGIMIRNSEVGACSITFEVVLFDFICGNHILWGAVIDKKYRRRHVGANVAQKAITEILKMAREYNERTATQDEQIIRTLVTHEIAATKEAVIDELKKLGYSAKAASEAYDTCEAQDPTLNPRSYWGIMAGTTRNSQESGYQDDRLALDQLAAAVLKKGAAQLVTV